MNIRAFWRLSLLILAVAFLIAACSSAAPTEAPVVEPTQVEATAPSPYLIPLVDPALAYLPPGQGVEQVLPAYPAPGQSAYPAPGQSAYPAPGQPAYPAPGEPSAGIDQAATQVAATLVAQVNSSPNLELVATDPATVQLASGKVQLVEFFAFWDGTSKALAPVINELKNAFGDRMNFVFLDIDDPANQKFKDQLGYKLQPHFFLLDKQGNILRDWQGYVDIVDLRSTFEGALQ